MENQKKNRLPEQFALFVNGQLHQLKSRPDEPLLWVLRDVLSLTGTKFGCGEGLCGSCTVLINDQPVRSCRLPISTVSAEDRIETIEGIAGKDELSSLQKAFIEHNAFGCGYCTAGQIMSATALLRHNPGPDREEIQQAMNGNLCRCAAYSNIVRAIESVADETVS